MNARRQVRLAGGRFFEVTQRHLVGVRVEGDHSQEEMGPASSGFNWTAFL